VNQGPRMSPEAQSLCDGGQELLPFGVRVLRGDTVAVEIRVCRSIARIRVWRDDVLPLVDADVEDLHFRTPARPPHG